MAASPRAQASPAATASEGGATHEGEEQPTAVVSGRVVEAGASREPVSAAVIMVVAAPPDVRPGKTPKEPMDPEALTWMVRGESDDEGRFRLDAVPAGKVRIIVVAGGYARLEVWAEIEAAVEAPIETGSGRGRGAELTLRLTPDEDSAYRTEVRSEKTPKPAAPTYTLDGEQGRHYAGSGDEPLVAALSLPGVARSPGGLGLMSLRGASPNWTGYYVDGHPVPRGFHIVPIASVVYPSLIDRVDLHPGTYPASFGGFGGGLVQLHTHRGKGDEGTHGEAHVDLFDIGGSLQAPVGLGAIQLAMRRSHVDGVLGGVDRVVSRASGVDSGALTGQFLLPSFWDYASRLDLPLDRGQNLSVRALGAGDRLEGGGLANSDVYDLDFRARFHRFDLEYRIEEDNWRALISPSVRLESNHFRQFVAFERDAWVGSGRMEFAARLQPWLEVEVGSDLVYERWRRSDLLFVEGPYGTEFDEQGYPTVPPDPTDPDARENTSGEELKLGLWLAATLRVGEWEIVPAVRANVFHYSRSERVSFDPRLFVRGRVHEKISVEGSVGLFAVPLVLRDYGASVNALPSTFPFGNGYVHLPAYLSLYFDPGIEGETADGSLGISRVLQSAVGVEASLPWELMARATLYWREGFSESLYTAADYSFAVPRRRGMGAELMLGRPFGAHLDGWIGYTLAWSRIENTAESPSAAGEVVWRPAIFDQRHNLVVQLSSALPRGFRLGARFRVVSGNPDRLILGSEIVDLDLGWTENGIIAPRGTTYRPLFHQLDLRVDKRWVKKRTVVGVYLDIQNVYNNLYPEAWIYTANFSQRTGSFGLPIYPSLGVQVEF